MPSSLFGATVHRQINSHLLAARHRDTGWSYGPDVPSDADSTAWCLAALERARAFPVSERLRSLAFLWSHASDGGVVTFRDAEQIRKYIGVHPDITLTGWCQPHADVTAAAVCATAHRAYSRTAIEALRWLMSRQTGAGFIESYWWRGPHYATTLTLRGCAAHRRVLPTARAELTLGALRREQLSDGGYTLGASDVSDPFTTALALESLVHLSYLGRSAELRKSAVECLLRKQSPDGGWEGDYVMRLPAPDVTNPRIVSDWSRGGKGGNSFIADRGGLFATALGIHALQRFVQAAASRKRAIGATRPALLELPISTPSPGEIVMAGKD